MYITASQKRLVVAILLGGLIIAGAILVRSHSHKPAAVASATPVVTAEPTRDPIPVTDKNHDGVPDWQEALVQTKPIILNATDSKPYTGSSTLTDRFSRTLFQQIMEAKAGGIFGQSSTQIASTATAELFAAAQDTLITPKDVVVSQDNSPAALSAYGATIAQIVENNSSTTAENEVAIFNKALQDQNPDELKPLDAKIAAYSNMLEQTKQVPVPSNLLQQQLNLLNSYQAVLNDIKAMRDAFNDPVLAGLRLKRYESDAAGLYNSIVQLYTKLVTSGASWPTDSVVYTLVGIQQQN